MNAGGSYIVYGRPDSSAVARVMWTIGELGLPHERRDWGGPFGGNDDPAYRAMNPAGRIPTLVWPDGRSSWESKAIIRALAAVHDPGGLIPVDPVERAAAEAWMDWSDEFQRAVSELREHPRRREAEGEILAAAVDRAAPALGLLDARLHGRAFIMGGTLSIADLAIGVWAHRWVKLPADAPGLPAFPAMSAWCERLRERPAYQTHVVAQVSAGARGRLDPPA
ncbi:glutathione S-transferase [bacterium]|nr:glutathione S-transferase [bacterium]